MSKTIAVRQLAEFAFRQGDLHPERTSKPVDAQLGIATQQLLQSQRKRQHATFSAEVAVNLEIKLAGDRARLAGRVDGLIQAAEEPWRVEEYKTTRERDVVLNPVDWGQGLIYVALLAQQYELDSMQLAIVYIHPETLQEQIFEELVALNYATRCLALALLCYDVRVCRHKLRTEQRVQWLQQRNFPYPHYRGAQQAIARQVFRSLRNGDHLLLEAPTGAGKSVATLYPALKQMSPEHRLFFLTSKSSGADAGLKAAAVVADHSGHLCVVQISAKEKVCQTNGEGCVAHDCRRCKDYYSRAPYAVNALLALGIADRKAIARVASEFSVCPFELSLDAALWADVIIGDYNYVFDPFVKLQRFADASKSLLLIDEAHQLSHRVATMLSAELKIDLNRQPNNTLGEEFERVVAVLRRDTSAAVALTNGTQLVPLKNVSAIDRAATALMDCVDDLELFDSLDPEALALYFGCYRWVRGLDWHEPECYCHIAEISDDSLVVRRQCLDAGDQIDATLEAHAGSVRFSGTVSPLALYQRLHGRADEMVARAQSPFNAAQTAVLIVDDIPTYYRQRGSSMQRLSSLVNQVVAAAPGRYLLGFASYAYLHTFSEQHKPLNYSYVAQARNEGASTFDQHRQYLEQESSVVFGVVMGGSFSESVEFINAPLSGIIVVGLGLPPPSLQRDLTVQYFDQTVAQGWGQMVAYHQPALTKVVQMAGRLLRSEQDRGVICLVDERFAQAQIQSFLPSHWRSQKIGLNQLKSALQAFW